MFKDYWSKVLVCKAYYEAAVLIKFFHHSVLELGQVISALLPCFVLFKEQFKVSCKIVAVGLPCLDQHVLVANPMLRRL